MLVLTVTRQCNLRCSYCSAPKDDWPSLSAEDCTRAIELFAGRYGGGDVKIFGGEPLLVPEATRAAAAAAQAAPEIHRVYLSTNGLALDADWLALVRETPKLVLTVSLDGTASDHDLHRRRRGGEGGSYERAVERLPELLATPRVVVTQTIPPALAHRAAENLEHLLSLGFRRFNLLPGYFLPWSEEQLTALRDNFARIARLIEARWERGERFYLRNLFTWAPSAFFNQGLIVDADRRIHASNLGQWGSFEELLEETLVGDLDHPPAATTLAVRGRRVLALLEKVVPGPALESTRAVDAALTAFCRRLYPALAARRRRERDVA
ncbi:MAG: radical SAM protein [bacterium]